MPEVRRLTTEGVAAYSNYLYTERTAPRANEPPDILYSRELSEALPGPALIIEKTTFKNRLELGRHLCEMLKQTGSDSASTDPHMWSWLSLFYFNQLCPIADDGMRKVGEGYRYIPSMDYRHYYRHLLLGPYWVFRNHAGNGRLLLAGTIDSPGDIYEQLASRQELAVSKGIIGTADHLYFDVSTSAPKKGTGSTTRPGALRRFVAVLRQLDLTYDLQSMNPTEILGLLPREFDNWKA